MDGGKMDMQVSSVCIVDDGTINGHVAHIMSRSPTTAQGHHLEFQSAGKCHKKHGHLPQIPFFTAGQDTYAHTSKSIAVSDGHGLRGHHVARALLRGPGSILQTLDTRAGGFEQRLANNESPWSVASDIRKVVCAHIASVNEADSGATLTAMLLLSSGSRRWVVTINVGDSEALLVYNDTVHVCSDIHNWDNAGLYKRYARHVQTNGFKPSVVCYNRWNDRTHKYKLRDTNRQYQPIMLYEGDEVSTENARHVSSLFQNKRKLRHGTQSVRKNFARHENWGSCVMFGGKARGQSMATFGDRRQRDITHVPIELCHVYIRELQPDTDVTAIVQTDGVSNGMTLEECGRNALLSAAGYLEHVSKVNDDMCVCMAHWRRA